MLYHFQKFLLLTLALPSGITVYLKAEIKEKPGNNIITSIEGCPILGDAEAVVEG